MFEIKIAPTLPPVSLAPTIATDAGSKSGVR